MSFVVQLNSGDYFAGCKVKKRGSITSFTKNICNAKIFKSIELAEREAMNLRYMGFGCKIYEIS